MKRSIAVFLLCVMALVSVQPVIAMHYCGNKLYSWDLFVSNDNSSCCQTEAIEHSNSSENHDCNIQITHNSCCDFETIQVSTDEYQSQIQELNPIQPALSVDNVWFALNYLLQNTVSEPPLTSLKNDFPPGGLFLQDVSILNFICIYRI